MSEGLNALYKIKYHIVLTMGCVRRIDCAKLPECTAYLALGPSNESWSNTFEGRRMWNVHYITRRYSPNFQAIRVKYQIPTVETR